MFFSRRHLSRSRPPSKQGNELTLGTMREQDEEEVESMESKWVWLRVELVMVNGESGLFGQCANGSASWSRFKMRAWLCKWVELRVWAVGVV